MIYKLYSIKDELNGFAPAVPFSNENIATRYFKDQMIENPTFKNSPEDFSIWYMGTFDTESGTIIQDPNKDIKLIMRGSDQIHGNKNNV